MEESATVVGLGYIVMIICDFSIYKGQETDFSVYKSGNGQMSVSTYIIRKCSSFFSHLTHLKKTILMNNY